MFTHTAVCIDQVPQRLVCINQWLLWKYGTNKNGKQTKLPVSATTGQVCDAHSPHNWTTFGTAVSAMPHYNASGIAFTLTLNTGIVGGDLDHCVNLMTNQIAPWAQEIVYSVNSYTERTPSGEGLRFFAYGTLPVAGRKKNGIELYADKRFLTVTGQRLEGVSATIEYRADVLQQTYARVFAVKPSSPPETNQKIPLSDADVLALAFKAANGVETKALYDGDNLTFKTPSEADASLMWRLAFYTQSPVGGGITQLERLLRGSGRYALRKDKWDSLRGEQVFLSYECDRLLERFRAQKAPTYDRGGSTHQQAEASKCAPARNLASEPPPEPDEAIPTLEGWKQQGRDLVNWKCRNDDRYRWEVGDWYNATHVPHGEKEAFVRELFKEMASTVRRWANVCKAWPKERRQQGVSFWVHMEMAGLSEDDQTRQMQAFRKRPCTREELRNRLGTRPDHREPKGWAAARQMYPAVLAQEMVDAGHREGSSAITHKIRAALGIGAYKGVPPDEADGKAPAYDELGLADTDTPDVEAEVPFSEGFLFDAGTQLPLSEPFLRRRSHRSPAG